jgi:hypothetical protein
MPLAGGASVTLVSGLAANVLAVDGTNAYFATARGVGKVPKQ